MPTVQTRTSSPGYERIDIQSTASASTSSSSCCSLRGCCSGFWRAMGAFFAPPINRDTVLEDYIPLVKRTRILLLGLLTFIGMLNCASILYVMKMIEKYFEDRIPNLEQAVPFGEFYFQFYISIAIMFLAPVALYTLTFWPLFLACRYHERIQKVEDRFKKKVKVKKSDSNYGAAGTGAGATAGVADPAATHLQQPSVISPRSNLSNNTEDAQSLISQRPSHLLDMNSMISAPSTANGIEISTWYERYNIGASRKALFCVALFGAFCVVILCSICCSGVLSWGGAGVIFDLKVKDAVKTLYDASAYGKTNPDTSLHKMTLIVLATPIAASGMWFILLMLMFGLVIVPIALEFRRQHANILVVITVVLALGLVSFLIWEMVKVTRRELHPELGRRLCFKNSCGKMIRVGQVGGATGISCKSGCPDGTVCNPGNKLCHFVLNFDDIYLASGGSQCVPFGYSPVETLIYPKTGGVVKSIAQWSGSIYASSHCDTSSGKCKTAICNDCKPYVGPVGPTTQAEMTLLVKDRDYYDVTIINGANLPIQVSPIKKGGQSFEEQFVPNPQTPEAYYCASPGATEKSGKVPKSGQAASWKFQTTSNNIPLIVNERSGSSCKKASDCDIGETCGTAMNLNSDGLPLPTVSNGVCGTLAGIWSEDELCSWTAANDFNLGNGISCKQLVNADSAPAGATFQDMFACDNAYATSCFQKPLTDSQKLFCCGCTVWSDLDLTPTLTCTGNNPAWEKYAQPTLKMLKSACPSCYTYPYDDSTSLFNCQGKSHETAEKENATDTEPPFGDNTNSYDIEWCSDGDITIVEEWG